jgi:hypothetical protein
MSRPTSYRLVSLRLWRRGRSVWSHWACEERIIEGLPDAVLTGPWKTTLSTV